ncbi:MAG: hypothetical protein LBR44_11870 [Clostridiales Family XIII bacterium]|jgi:hypothetical protein|nr:hypothetical protein [Clostridiales Family XIII bacterium]
MKNPVTAFNRITIPACALLLAVSLLLPGCGEASPAIDGGASPDSESAGNVDPAIISYMDYAVGEGAYRVSYEAAGFSIIPRSGPAGSVEIRFHDENGVERTLQVTDNPATPEGWNLRDGVVEYIQVRLDERYREIVGLEERLREKGLEGFEAETYVLMRYGQDGNAQEGPEEDVPALVNPETGIRLNEAPDPKTLQEDFGMAFPFYINVDPPLDEDALEAFTQLREETEAALEEALGCDIQTVLEYHEERKEGWLTIGWEDAARGDSTRAGGSLEFKQGDADILDLVDQEYMLIGFDSQDIEEIWYADKTIHQRPIPPGPTDYRWEGWLVLDPAAFERYTDPFEWSEADVRHTPGDIQELKDLGCEEWFFSYDFERDHQMGDRNATYAICPDQHIIYFDAVRG